jgi:hypothetical protein
VASLGMIPVGVVLVGVVLVGVVSVGILVPFVSPGLVEVTH